jgi:CBS domain containing-hemolysin-like protein
LVTLSARTGFSRFPVVGDDLDDIAGAIHIKQAFTVPAADRQRMRASALMRPVPTVPESLPGDALLNRLRDSSFQLAVVVDEYGGTAGIVTLEDVVEEIIGDVRDEHDSGEAPASRRLASGSWLVSGQLPPASACRKATTRRWPGWCCRCSASSPSPAPTSSSTAGG